MKKLLLGALALSTFCLSAEAQRMTLHEEFTGENCGPCAATNPDFWTLCNGASNPSKLIHIAYMVPIPTTGWFTQRNTPVNSARSSYYSVSSAPFGKYDGNASVPTHPASFTQAMIDAEALVAAPFNITVTNSWDATYDTVVTNITVTCVAATSSSSLKLRCALVQTHNFLSPPGSNGETHFENVVQDMFPSATGTAMASSWTVGMSQTYTIKGKCPSYTEKGKSPYMVVWIQDDADKNIKQAAKASALPPVPNDAALTGISQPSRYVCGPDGAYTVATHTVTITNDGNNPITSATIYSKGDVAGTWVSSPWTGSIPAGGSATATVSTGVGVTIAGAGAHRLYDSIANVNAGVDNAKGNNAGYVTFFTQSTTGLTLPMTMPFESADAAKLYFFDANNNGNYWGVFTNSTPFSHGGTMAAAFRCFYYSSGETEIMTIPTPAFAANREMKFWQAYAQQTSASNDKLEVVYSTDCGTNWTSVWSKSGSDLATAPLSSAFYIPTPAQYVERTVDLSTVPSGAIIGFRGVTGTTPGNNILLDDVDIHATTAVADVVAGTVECSVFPNPAKDVATVTVELATAGEASITLFDGVGRVVSVIANGAMTAGAHTYTVNTANLAAGLYNVTITVDGNATTKRLTVIK